MAQTSKTKTAQGKKKLKRVTGRMGEDDGRDARPTRHGRRATADGRPSTRLRVGNATESERKAPTQTGAGPTHTRNTPARKEKKTPRKKQPAAPNFEPAPWNPRRITAEALAGLRASIETFGDLSGIVVNDTTGHIVCGHQRRQVLKDVDWSGVQWGEPYRITLGHAASRFASSER